MRHCLITTFFGAHSFGGDATYVDHLSRALLRRGDEVMVVYNRDAYEILKGDRKDRMYDTPTGLRLHGLQTCSPMINLLHIHQTGSLGAYRNAIRALIDAFKPDVVHFHNISLIGGLELLSMPLPDKTIRMMTAHEHWLTCPLSLLWKMNREVCEHSDCTLCTLKAKRPPQLWRSADRINAALAHLDRLIFPSENAFFEHRKRGITHQNAMVLPYFLPEDWMKAASMKPDEMPGRPYMLMAGRLVKEKGFQSVISIMGQFPEMDLKIAGTGPYQSELRRVAADLPNVQFLNYRDQDGLIDLYRHAKAVIVPSLFLETFCYIVIEAFSTKTPVIVRDRGPLPELVNTSNGGLLFESEFDLAEKIRLILDDDKLGIELGENGFRTMESLWSEESHMKIFFDMIGENQFSEKRS